MTADLPAPPSANALFVVRDGRRRKTAAYARWRRDAGWVLKLLDKQPPKTPLRVIIEVAVNRTRDVDNTIKPIIDACQAADVIPDDRWVDVVEARRVPAGDLEAGWCRVGVYSLPASEIHATATDPANRVPSVSIT